MSTTWSVNDTQWHKTLDKASSFQMPYQLRRMFLAIFTHCDPVNSFKLWMDHCESLNEDYLLRLPYDDDAIQLRLNSFLADFDLPRP